VGILGTKVLLVGGSADGISPLATAEILDPAGPSFTPTSSMGTPRIGPTVLQLPAGRVVVLGGVNSGGITAVETFPN